MIIENLLFPAIAIAAYFLGSVSSAIILSRIMGFTDPRTEGSNNPGATNVLRIAGKKAAFLTLLGDFLKGLIPVVAVHLLGGSLVWAALAGFCAFVGHCFPVFFRFEGGKGVATAIAATIGFDLYSGFFVIFIWLMFAKVFKISSLAAIISFLALPAFIYWRVPVISIVLIFAIMSVILIWRHRSNIQRLIAGEES